MSGEIIRAGDKTSHGGTVVEGSQTDICMGKPIAFIGHMTVCPQCKGNFPIIEGVMTATFYGKGVAVAGMKTACGAVLLASQFTDFVEWSSGSRGSTLTDTKEPVSAVKSDGEEANDAVETQYFYRVTDGKGNPIDEYRYDLRVADELHTKAGSFVSGQTVTIDGSASSQFVTWLNRDSGSRT